MHAKTIETLLQLGLIENPEDVDHPGLLNVAVGKRYLTMVEDLLKYGADVNILENSRFGESCTPLHNAVKSNQVEMAKLLISYGANVNAKCGEGTTPLVHAIANRNTEMTKLLLIKGADIKEDPNNLLCTAVDNGKLKIVEALLKYGAEVTMLIDNSDFRGVTPLHSAVKSNQVEIAKLLINYGANVNVRDGDGTIPIVDAIRNRATEMTKLLLTNGVDIKEYPNVLCTAVDNGMLKIVEDLLKYGAEVNMLIDISDFRGVMPLHSAVKSNQVEMAKLLINYGANVNAKGGEGTTPLVHAIANRNTKMTKLLLIKGADIKEDPNNLLCTAVDNGKLKIVEALLKYGAEVTMSIDNSDFRGVTPLHSAVKSNQVEIAKLLINYGANVNVRDGDGTTPIVDAIANRNAEMTKLLLINGADIKEDPNNLLCIAVENGNLNIVEDLLMYDADVNMLYNSRFGESLSPLHSAVKTNQVEMAKLLIDYGANVNVKDSGATTPLGYAIQNRSTEMTKLLLTNGADIKEDPNNLLFTAIENGSFKIVEDLLKLGADVNKLYSCSWIREEGPTPLYSAVIRNQVEIAKMLIHYKANVNIGIAGFWFESPIIHAVRENFTEMTKLLLINGVDLRHISLLLNFAVDNGNVEIVEELLKHGAYINATDSDGTTALHYTALCYGDNERRLKATRMDSLDPLEHVRSTNDVAELLLNKGANVNVATKAGITTLCAASYKGYEDIVEILLKYGAECDPRDEEVIKPLHAAAIGGHLKIIKDLLKFGAEVDSRDIYGRTALHFASREGHIEIVKTLLEYGSDVNIISKMDHTPLEYGKFFEDFDSDDGSDGVEDDDYHYNLESDETLLHTEDSSTTKLLKQHIAKIKVAGLHVSHRNFEWISDDREYNNFLNECAAEIEIMKSKNIDNSYVSFYDILTKNTNQLTKNESIVQALKSNDYKTKFPIYASMIAGRFRRAVEREELLKQVRDKFF